MKIEINGKTFETPEGLTILEAAAKAGVKIPTLCFLKGTAPGGVCGICEAEADGKPVRACVVKARDGMKIATDTDEIKSRRRERLLALAENHRFDCEFCARCMDCEFIRVLCENGIYDYEYQRRSNESHAVKLAGGIVHDDTLCIGCRRCAAACKDGSVTMEKTEAGFISRVDAEKFTGSGECAAVCPTAAFHIEEKEAIRAFKRATHDETCYAIITPDAAAVFGELFFDPAGGDFAGRMASVMRVLGCKKVFMAGRNASVSDISRAVKGDGIVTVSVSTTTGPVRPGADIDMTIHTLQTIFRRACVSRTTMIRTWRSIKPSAFDTTEGIVSSGPVEYSFGGAMPHRDCYTSASQDLAAIRKQALNETLS